MSDRSSKMRNHCKQVIWLVGLWAASVATVGLVAELLRILMEAAGLKSH